MAYYLIGARVRRAVREVRHTPTIWSIAIPKKKWYPSMVTWSCLRTAKSPRDRQGQAGLNETIS